jgi:hypothetical protein
VDGFVLAGLLGDRCGTAEGSDGFRAVEGFATIAPLGEHLGGVDLPRSWQRPEDLGVRVLVEVGGNGAVEVLDRPHQGTQGTDHGEHGISAGFGFGPSGDAGGSGSEPFDELGGGTPPGVAVLGEERGHAGFADAGGGGRGRVGSCRPSTPRPALCERWYAAAPTSSTSASPPTSSKRSWTRSGVGLHRHRRMAGLQQPVHQAAIGSFGRHRHLGRIAVASQTCGEPIKALRAVCDGEAVNHSALVIEDAHGVFLRRPVDPCEHVVSLVVWQHNLDEEDVPRAVTDWRSAARPSVAGPPSSEDRGRRCHRGPRRATEPGRHPDPHRVTGTLTAPARWMVDQ